MEITINICMGQGKGEIMAETSKSGKQIVMAVTEEEAQLIENFRRSGCFEKDYLRRRACRQDPELETFLLDRGLTPQSDPGAIRDAMAELLHQRLA